MFGTFKPIPFDPYGRRRARRGVPRWLILLLTGIAIGSGGIVLLQEKYLPPRLSAAESTQLREALATAQADRQRFESQVQEANKALQAAQAERSKAVADMESSRTLAEDLRRDVGALVSALPPDPRGGSVEVRAGQFQAKGGALAYDVVLTRERGGDKPVPGVMQLTVAGLSARGVEANVKLDPVTLSLGPHEVVRGSLPLPAGFTPRQTTVQILDRGEKLLGMRVLLVR